MKVAVCLLLAVAVAYAAPSDRAACGPFCMIYCPFGNVLDSNGCLTCSCNSAPIEKSKACFGVMCLIHCHLGFKLGTDVCPGCACNTVTPLPTITPPSTTMVMRVKRL